MAFLLIVVGNKRIIDSKGYATIWQLLYLFTLKSLTSYNELFLDLFQAVRVIQFCLRSHPEHIPHFNHGERKHYSSSFKFLSQFLSTLGYWKVPEIKVLEA